jgi:hypothetical protein
MIAVVGGVPWLGWRLLEMFTVVSMAGCLGQALCASNYFIPLETYEISCLQPREVGGPGARIEMMGDVCVTYEAVIYCFQYHLDAVNVTIPYPVGNWTQLRDSPMEVAERFIVMTLSMDHLQFDAIPFEDRTLLRIRLPESLQPGSDFAIMLRYFLMGALERAERTHWDRQLGRGENFRIGFRPPVQDASINEIKIEISAPSWALVKKWGPVSGMKVLAGGGMPAVEWQVDEPATPRPEYWVVFGRGGVGANAIYLLVLLGVVSFAVILLAALFVRSRYGHKV